MALALFPKLDLTKTYFMVAGIAGVNPEVATLASVGLSKYAVQVGLAYEFDAREIPANFSTGYVSFGQETPLTYPTTIYGTEVFELNEALRDWAFNVSSGAKLNDSDESVAYRAQYKNVSAYAAGAALPSLIKADTLCSDVYYSGNLLSTAFGNYTTLITNGSGVCMLNLPRGKSND
jgi:purine nucleoside permease